MTNVRANAEAMVARIDALVAEERANAIMKEKLMSSLRDIKKRMEDNSAKLEVFRGAIEVLNKVSDKNVDEAYKFLMKNINTVLERAFVGSKREIRIKEYMRNETHPQLEISVLTSTGAKRQLSEDCGHGIAQIVSLLMVMCSIVITGSRRLLVLDEVVSGLHASKLEVLDEILWSFTEIGFQFIINEHGYVPKGAKVYEFVAERDSGRIGRIWTERDGIYKVISNDGAGESGAKALENKTTPKAPESGAVEVVSL